MVSRVRIALNSKISNLDHIEISSSASKVLASLHEPLLRISSGGLVVPGIAKSWISKGDKVVFKLRESCFNDGEPIKAEHFVRAHKEILVKAKYAHRYFVIKNAIKGGYCEKNLINKD
jgi:ABC-type transport system substrate-binding protein